MHPVYVVIAAHGSYSDYTERLLCWLQDKADAEEFAKLCRKDLDDALAKCHEDPEYESWELGIGYKVSGKWWELWKHPNDPGWGGGGFDAHYTRYFVSEIPKAVWQRVQ